MLDLINLDDESKTSTNLEILNTIPDTETETQAKVQIRCKPKQTMKLVKSSPKKIVSKQTRQEMIPTGD
ncbi:2423_t:CDS:1, partial [Dentiscutata heterogama]